jgi:hypothetical protein
MMDTPPRVMTSITASAGVLTQHDHMGHLDMILKLTRQNRHHHHLIQVLRQTLGDLRL